jgi:hypothetical protein
MSIILTRVLPSVLGGMVITSNHLRMRRSHRSTERRLGYRRRFVAPSLSDRSWDQTLLALGETTGLSVASDVQAMEQEDAEESASNPVK